MVKGVVSKSTMMSDSDSGMNLNSEISGYSFQTRSSRSGTPNSTISTTKCQTLKDVMRKIQIAEKDIKKFESFLQKPKPGAPHRWIQDFAEKEQKNQGNFDKRASKFTSPDYPGKILLILEKILNPRKLKVILKRTKPKMQR
ncbi:hypothetical protein TNIN_95181 [Trichonephila inaurata madagascariensis]|uniref:Uncharacterized protein n=1 Tax=Trichonephila inaurata madagascariensis TaxID=2747483 RepID=A0A8X6IR56_9ARAC|nr:hypothetical protein TNIN_95181 [Trichonephila inaurata madagascariensis]